MTDIINFSVDNFPSLICKDDWAGEWNSVALADLEVEEQTILADFEAQLGEPIEPVPEDFWEKILLVKCTEEREGGKIVDRLVKNIYGAGIYRDEAGGIVLKFGSGFWPVKQEKQVLIVGNLRGSIDFASSSREMEIDGANGGKVKVKTQNCWCTFVSATAVYEVPINTELKTNPVKNTILMHLAAEKSLYTFLKTPPSGNGGGGIENMKELGAGEFEVAECYLKDTPKNLDSAQAWVLRLADGQQCWARGLVEKQLSSYGYVPEKHQILKISNIKKVGDKTYLDCVLRAKKVAEPAQPIATPKKTTSPGKEAAPKATVEPDPVELPWD
jgi:hypothetical protein